METAVDGIVVLAQTGRTHLEIRHGGVSPVIGSGAHDGEARPALGAVDERIAVAAISWIEELAQTVRAGGDIGRYEGTAGTDRAVGDDELPVAPGLLQHRAHGLDTGEGGRFVSERVHKTIEFLGAAFRLHDHALAVVEDEAGQAAAFGQAVHEGPKTHALHDAANLKTAPLQGLRRREGHGQPAGVLGLTTSSSAPATCSRASLISRRVGPTGSVCFSMARTPKVTRPRVWETLRSVAAITIRYVASTTTTRATSTNVTITRTVSTTHSFPASTVAAGRGVVRPLPAARPRAVWWCPACGWSECSGPAACPWSTARSPRGPPRSRSVAALPAAPRPPAPPPSRWPG